MVEVVNNQSVAPPLVSAQAGAAEYGESPVVVIYLFIALACFVVAASATLLVTRWTEISVLFYETSLARYEVMSGERGPATYLIFHKDFSALQAIAESTDEILGVEQSDFATVAKMAFRSAQSPLIEQVRNNPAVTSMVARNVPLLCH